MFVICLLVIGISSILVNRLRVVKSPAEMEYVRKTGELVDLACVLSRQSGYRGTQHGVFPAP
ncbi:MAG: hypothetical protein JSV83_12640, partial [Desulfobacterales bacterium]